MLWHFISGHLISFNQCLCWWYFTVICFHIKMEYFAHAVNKADLLFMAIAGRSFCSSFSSSLPSPLGPSLLYFPCLWFLAFISALCGNVFSLSLWWESPWSVSGLLCHAIVLGNFKWRVWKKDHFTWNNCSWAHCHRLETISPESHPTWLSCRC